MQFRRWNALALVATLVLSGCGTNSGGADDEVVLSERAAVVDAVTESALSAYASDGTLRFGSETDLLAGLEPGDVVVAGVVPGTAEAGFLREVTGIERDGAEVVLRTRPAMLTDVFRRVEASVRTELTSDLVTSATPHLDGLAIEMPAAPGLAPQGEHNDIILAFDEVLVDQGGVTVTVDGELTIDSEIVLEVDIDSTVTPPRVWVDRFELYWALDQHAELNLTAESALTFDREVPLATFQLASIEVMIGPVPLVLSLDLTLFLGADGELYARVTTGATQDASVDMGGRYTDANGWEGIWRPEASFEFQPPTFEAGARARAYVGARLAAGLYGDNGAAGTITTRAYVEGDAEFGRDPLWCLYSGLEATYGFKIEFPVVGDIAEHEEPLAGLRNEIACAENEPPEVTITAPSDGATFDEAQMWSYQSTADDREMTDAPDVTWTIDGEPAPPESFDVRTLCPGDHTLVATAVDDSGATSADAVTVTIVNRAPQVTIDEAPATAGEGNDVRLVGHATDPTCDDPGGTRIDPNDLVWTLQDGFDGTGGAIVTYFTSQGTKTVTLSYLDAGGLEGEAESSIDVGAFDPDAAPAVGIVAPQRGTAYDVSQIEGSHYLIDVTGDGGATVAEGDLVWSFAVGGGVFEEFARGSSATLQLDVPTARTVVSIRLHVDGEPVSDGSPSSHTIEVSVEGVAL